MEYRRLGRAGIKVSALSLGSWITYGTQVDLREAITTIEHAYEAGVNFFDNAQAYGNGESERIMGDAIGHLGLHRGSYLISTKLFWGIHDKVNLKNTLNRKYLLEGIEGCLERLKHDYVDIVFCHRADPETPVDETVWAMHDIVERGYAHYWGTSEWPAESIVQAFEIAERYSLRKPVVEQPQYNLFFRHRVEQEYAPLYKDYGLGTTTWSPLASGVLTGKYRDGIPAHSRLALPGYEWLREKALAASHIDAVEKLRVVATRLDCTLSQLAIAWCLSNPDVSTVILGASKLSQLKENLGALAVLERMTAGERREIESIVGPGQ